MRPFKVGDRVWDEDLGFGNVIEGKPWKIDKPVAVRFDTDANTTICYAEDGRFGRYDKFQSLFHADEVKDGRVQK